jgi:hypothetical protein
MESLNFHTSHRSSPGSTSLQLDISYTKELLNEKIVCHIIELAINSAISDISKSFLGNTRQRREQQGDQQGSQRNEVDQIIKQILCEGSNLSTV